MSPPAAWRALGDGFRVGVRVAVQDEPKVLQVPVTAFYPPASVHDGACVRARNM